MAREYTREIYLYINGKEVSNDIKSIKREMNLLVNEQNRMTIGSKEYVEAGKRIKILKGIIQEHNASLRQVDRSWRATLNNIGDQFNRFQTLGMAVIGGLVGVVAAFRKTAEAANEFEERLDNLSALTGLNGKELEWLGEKAKESSVSITESGVRIKQSASDIVDAYTKMGSQRPELLKDKEALAAVTEAAIVLSEAGKMDLEPATAALATTMNQFNLEATDANRIINTIAAGSKVGAGEIPYLTEVIEKSGTTANLMGMSVEQMVGTIEAIAPKFSEARRAGTALDRVLLKMREQGIGVKDGVFDLNRGIDELRDRFSKGQSSADLFGVEQAKMGEILVMNQGDINKYTREVTGTGIAFEQAGKNTDNASARLAQAKNKVQLMYIEIGQKLAPVVIHSTNLWNYFLKAVMALPDFLSKNRILLVSLAGAILAYNAALIKSIGLSIASSAAKVRDAVVTKTLSIQTGIQIAMTEAQATQTARLTVVQKMAVLTQQALNAAMKANPIGLVITGITALVAGLMYYNKNSKEALALEASRKSLTDDLTQANLELKTSYTMIAEDVSKLNTLSVEQKKHLKEQIDDTLNLAEAELELLQSRRNMLKAENSKVTFGQFVGNLFSPDKLKEKARENSLKAVEPIDALLDIQKDRIKSLKDQRSELVDIMNAEIQGDQIGSDTEAQLEAKLERYCVALKNVAKGGADYVRVQNKIKKVEAELAKARGMNSALELSQDQEARITKAADDAYAARVIQLKKQYADEQLAKQDFEDQMVLEEMEYLKKVILLRKNAGLETLDQEGKFYDLLIKQNEEVDKRQLEQEKAYNEMISKEDDALLKEQINNALELSEQRDKEREEQLKKDKEADKELREAKLKNLETWANSATSAVETVRMFQEAAMNRELTAAGNNTKKREEIERKYRQKQKGWAIAQTLIEGTLEIARINSNAGVNADLSQTLRTVLTGLAIARTAGQIAVITAQQFAKGRYPVIGADDNRIYQATLLPSIKTGIYSRPTLGLFSEREPEMVIDGPTTRNIRANFPEILSAIQAVRVPQFATGKGIDLPAGGVGMPEEIADLLRANIRMMKEVREAHERPAVVSFQSIKERQEEYNSFRTRTTIKP